MPTPTLAMKKQEKITKAKEQFSHHHKNVIKENRNKTYLRKWNYWLNGRLPSHWFETHKCHCPLNLLCVKCQSWEKKYKRVNRRIKNRGAQAYILLISRWGEKVECCELINNIEINYNDDDNNDNIKRLVLISRKQILQFRILLQLNRSETSVNCIFSRVHAKVCQIANCVSTFRPRQYNREKDNRWLLTFS